MRILAIDPGPTESAILRWLWVPGWDALLRDGGRIAAAEILPNDMVLSSLAFYTPDTIDVVAIEKVQCYGMAVGEKVFDTVWWSGRFFERAPVLARRIPYPEVALHHCHSRRAKESNVAQALRDKYGEKGTKKSPGLTYPLKSHLWSAFAIATYVSETL